MEKETAARTERKPINRLAVIALRELNKNTQAALQEIIEAAAVADGIAADAGWQFDPQSAQWVRQA
jgi:hypothetical protein